MYIHYFIDQTLFSDQCAAGATNEASCDANAACNDADQNTNDADTVLCTCNSGFTGTGAACAGKYPTFVNMLAAYVWDGGYVVWQVFRFH